MPKSPSDLDDILSRYYARNDIEPPKEQMTEGEKVANEVVPPEVTAVTNEVTPRIESVVDTDRPIWARPLTKKAALDTISEAECLLSGERREEYLEHVSGLDGILDLPNETNYKDSLRLIRNNLTMLRGAAPEKLEKKIGQYINNSSPSGMNILHWLYFKNQFPWVEEDIEPFHILLLEKIKKALIRFLRDHNSAIKPLLESRPMAGDHFTIDVLAECGSAARGDTNEWLLQNNAVTGQPYHDVCEHLDLDVSTLTGPILDLGPGVGNFAIGLRQRGLEVHTIDELSIADLKARVPRINPMLRQTSCKGLEGFMRADQSELERWHRQGSAVEVAEVFDENTFKHIFACDSIIQPLLYPIYRKNPGAFWNNLKGPLKALDNHGGEFRATVFGPHMLYTEANMEAYLLPFFLAMRAGGFEIPGAYDEQGRFSLEKFTAKYNDWKNKPHTIFKIRKHPFSDIERAEEVMKKCIDEVQSLEEICGHF